MVILNVPSFNAILMYGKRQQSHSAESGVFWRVENNCLFFFYQEIHTQKKLCEEVHCKEDKPVFQAYEREELNVLRHSKLAAVTPKNHWLVDHWKTDIYIYIV
jgi:hypothetical protein